MMQGQGCMLKLFPLLISTRKRSTSESLKKSTKTTYDLFFGGVLGPFRLLVRDFYHAILLTFQSQAFLPSILDSFTSATKDSAFLSFYARFLVDGVVTVLPTLCSLSFNSKNL